MTTTCLFPTCTANGVIPHALVVSGMALERPELVDAGIGALRWLMDIQTDARGHFVPIGNDGWFARNGTPARFDQQPTEAQHMVDALLEVHQVTGEERWLEDARCCFEWFLGRNDLQQAIADDTTGACRDGLHPDGVNQNQGAESTIAWLHASMNSIPHVGPPRRAASPRGRPASRRAAPTSSTRCYGDLVWESVGRSFQILGRASIDARCERLKRASPAVHWKSPPARRVGGRAPRRCWCQGRWSQADHRR